MKETADSVGRDQATTTLIPYRHSCIENRIATDRLKLDYSAAAAAQCTFHHRPSPGFCLSDAEGREGTLSASKYAPTAINFSFV